MTALIILGSARSDGNTAAAARQLLGRLGPRAELIDLLDLCILPYRYDGYDQADDFLGLADRMVAHRQIVFATPVYWYAMSGGMKHVFDRLTDLTRTAKDKGRALAGRSVWLLATGTDPDLPPGFTEPFARTADYLGMQWRGAAYVPFGKHAMATGWKAIGELAARLLSFDP